VSICENSWLNFSSPQTRSYPKGKIENSKKKIQIFLLLILQLLMTFLRVLRAFVVRFFWAKRASSPLYRETLFFCASRSLKFEDKKIRENPCNPWLNLLTKNINYAKQTQF